ncbi:DUF2325 domain-containing protein [Piscinibacter terrae]|uniref:DUF2325 domain-containing protein n=1 Tax=Piscinibacter terrae TaxID=2496871 RepID=A0A3N7HMD0_9BURK|nr:DUF2325 domain-containing protein [Albitalea terrae]RQP22216.1 DUF2325 domain-containing protein [Albitalea terrae]
MCESASPTPAHAEPAAPTGSRRRRIWEFGTHAHCPIVGVCLPMAALRRLVDKVLHGQTLADDYELHCGVIAECQKRSAIAEAVQRELDRRFMLSLRGAAQAKSTDALRQWWHDASRGKDLAGALWATLTHARCTSELEHEVLGEIHMIQHQMGMARRVDLERFESLIDENAVLSRQLGAAQQRSTRLCAEHARQMESQQAEVVRLRAQLAVVQTVAASLREDMAALEATVPGLTSRIELVRDNERQIEHIRTLEHGLLQSQHEANRQRRRAAELEAALAQRNDAAAVEQPTAATPSLHDRAVLCVGGRPASVPVYRYIVEKTGGRFLHHDGGEEESPARLDATLAAADLVICQTGCISHNAYWRVKDHCKRTGKQCVFVESPSTAGLKRALRTLAPATDFAG